MKHLPRISQLLVAFATIATLSGCVNTRFLEDGEVLFKQNRVIYTENLPAKEHKELSAELKDISQLQPNSKFIGLTKLRLWFYNVANQRKETKFRYWMKFKVGEAPVIYDSLYAEKSVFLMKNYLTNQGYFYSTVEYQTIIRRKKASIVYLVELGDVYRVHNVIFPKDSSEVSRLTYKNKDDSKIVPCHPFGVAELKAERERIANDLRNQGYYYFNKGYVNFDIDSNNTTKTLDIAVRLLNPTDSTEHQVYYINNVYIQTDFSLDQLRTAVDLDTLIRYEYYFISEVLKYKPEVLINSIHIKKNDKYSRSDYQLTISHLADLGVFKFINIKYQKSDVIGAQGQRYLDCVITLTPSKKQEWGVEAEVNNNTYFFLGMALTFSYKNKNVFKGAELFDFNLIGGFETNFDRGRAFFNTVDVTASAQLYLNKFLVPFKLKRTSKYFKPKTILSLRSSFLSRISYYTVSTTNLSFGYDWKESINKRHILNPIAISLVRVLDESAAFREILARSQSLKNSFTEQLIVGWDYTYLWNSKPERFDKTDFFIRAHADVAGNLQYCFSTAVNKKKGNDPPYKMFGTPYAQYVMMHFETKNYTKIGKEAQLVTRFYTGVGYAYGNSENLPYVKQFFSGGSNGIRAWRVRTLGPGSFVFEDSDVSNVENFFYDQTGDMKIESNIELRFPMFKFIKGAVFLDAGNIWTLAADSLRPGANFEINRFYKELALGGGIGLRFDFSYFVLRFDVATPIFDPGAQGENWRIKKFNWSSRDTRREFLKFNLAIGYPF